MTVAELLLLVLTVSIAGTVPAVGLRTRREDVMYLFRDAGTFARSRPGAPARAEAGKLHPRRRAGQGERGAGRDDPRRGRAAPGSIHRIQGKESGR
ncbi:hypothetical protein [Longimicrobium sp.]|uniref:hypothetical protein n=1 Tax=Longimicrobium sp. TaxID=2029185 RepID=UPI002E314DCD|nr:hypothetical protein [Longimicrobium sp.]HEX6041530.1 hypothetical protein [Longimicrobium sp.]